MFLVNRLRRKNDLIIKIDVFYMNLTSITYSDKVTEDGKNKYFVDII